MGFLPFFPAAPSLPLAGGTLTGPLTVPGITDTAALSVAGLATLNGGSKTSGSAPVLSPVLANGVAAQLADVTRDYMVYMTLTASGTAFILAIGPTSGVADVLVPSATVTVGDQYSFRLPAGWFAEWSGVTVTVSTIAIGC